MRRSRPRWSSHKHPRHRSGPDADPSPLSLVQDLRGVELIGRRRMLQKALKRAGPALRFSEHMEGADGEAMFRHACALGLRGSSLSASRAATSRARA